MILLVDIGNTRLKWALLPPHGGVGNPAARLRPGGIGDHTPEHIHTAFEMAWSDLHGITRVWAVCVAGVAVAAQLEDWVRKRWGVPCHFLHASATAAGVCNAYREPGQLGDDRWAALIGARASEPGRVCVIDCGTALTLDVLDAQGQHQGGLIVPGLALMRHALAMRTADLDGAIAQTGSAADRDPTRAGLRLGVDTPGCVANGTVQALTGLITQVLIALAPAGIGVSVLCTGGDAPAIMAGLARDGLPPLRHVPALVLQGLAQVAEEAVVGT